MKLESLLAKAGEGIAAGRSFGPVIEADGCLLVPVAIHVGGGGGGSGGPEGTAEAGEGGGFGVVSYPLGMYVVRDGTARWVPAIDVTFLAVGAISLVRAMVRRGRSRRAR